MFFNSSFDRNYPVKDTAFTSQLSLHILPQHFQRKIPACAYRHDLVHCIWLNTNMRVITKIHENIRNLVLKRKNFVYIIFEVVFLDIFDLYYFCPLKGQGHEI